MQSVQASGLNWCKEVSRKLKNTEKQNLIFSQKNGLHSHGEN